MVPDFLVIGHVSQDITPDIPAGWRLGGTAAFAALLAQRLGLHAAMLTSAAVELDLAALLPGIDITLVPAAVSTSFENRYVGERRSQTVCHQAAPLTARHLPRAWRQAWTVLVAPILNEVSADMAAQFASALVGICLQGWLRRRDAQARVYTVPAACFAAERVFGAGQVLFVSDEDLAAEADIETTLHRWAAQVSVLVYTMGPAGAHIWHQAWVHWMPPFPVQAVDPTGAGDVFAAGFLVRLAETGSVPEAARFAAAAAALSVTAPGLEAVPDRAAITTLLEAHPEVQLSRLRRIA